MSTLITKFIPEKTAGQAEALPDYAEEMAAFHRAFPDAARLFPANTVSRTKREYLGNFEKEDGQCLLK